MRVQVAVEPALPSELPALERGLQLLNRADAFVQVSVSEATGEWLLGAAGEIHLETCLKDLRERFARVELQVSPPLVSFKESVVHPAEVPEDSAEGPLHTLSVPVPWMCQRSVTGCYAWFPAGDQRCLVWRSFGAATRCACGHTSDCKPVKLESFMVLT